MKKGISKGVVYELSEPKRTAKCIPPPDCTGDVHHGFCGGGARIVGFDDILGNGRNAVSRVLFWKKRTH